ncbi:DUF6221 family protein [Streptomyces sp. NPDC059788]|uniref:DUF6221 family protein n=1 Tax=Streptomyces sp. NPDC059788 TaxID=3346948 RepID=UPI003653CB42
MNDLTQFLRDRLGEDEAAARATTERQPYDEWDAAGAGDDSDSRLSHWEVVKIARPHATPAAKSVSEHIARHDPARVLAEVDAKRRLLVVHAKSSSYDGCVICDDGNDSCGCMGGAHWEYPCDTVKLLALSYADHPDYRQEWRP